jgi:large repetitive protein
VTGNIDQNETGAIGYRFNATAGQHLYLNTGGGQYPNAWLLYNINGQYINYGHIQDDYYFDDREFDITATGEYLLFMQGAGAASTNYKFTISDSQFTTGAIAIGDTVNGQIAKQGQQNTYTFSGTAGQQLQFDVLSRGGYLTNIARIYNPSGTEVYSRSLYELDSADLLILKETGNYRIVVDGNGASTDAYSFRLFDVQAEVTAIGLDAEVSGRLATGQETKFYQFVGAQGQKLYFDWLSNSPNTQWSLYDRAGNQLDYRNVSDYETTLTSDGEYTIAVRGYHNAAVDYSFRLVTPDATTQVIDFRGASAVVSGNLGERGEVDVYTFAGTIGQRLVLDPQVIAAGINVRLYTPAGVPLDNVNLLTLNETGTYRFVVDGSSGATGSYGFRVLDPAAASTIQLDTEIAGTFGTSGLDSNIYRFRGVTGQRLYFSTGGGADNNTWAIYDPSGNKITEGSVATKSPSSTFDPFNAVDLDLTTTGEYLVVFGGNGAANNNYRFALAAPDSVTQALTLGAKVTGSLDKFGDIDTYTFTGAVGQRLYFDGLTGSNLQGRLYSKTGTLVKESAMSSDWGGGITLTEAGEYRFVVDGVKSNVGSYSFRLSDQSTVTALTFGSEFLGRAETDNSAALYRFSGVNGQRLLFDVIDGVNNPYLNWSLYDSNHRQVNPVSFAGVQD